MTSNSSLVGRFVRVRQNSVPQKGIGKLIRVDGGKATVRFFDYPDELNPEQIITDVKELQLVKLPTQTRIYHLDAQSSRWQVGRILEGEGSTVLVQFPNKNIVNLDVKDLEVRWRKPIRDPLAFLIRQVNDTPRFSDARSQFLKAVIRQRSVSLGMSALLSSSIQLTDYQYRVIKRVLQDPVQRYLLADEVGLGKTIEAGVLIRQFILDNPETAKVLVIVPVSLVDQWRLELIKKFNLDAWIDETLNVISSDDLYEVERLMPGVGMLVVDEAHHLSRINDGQSHSLFELVRQSAKEVPSLLLLSATPALADTHGFLRLLHLLDPVVFPLEDLEGFERRIESRQVVAELVAKLVPENLLVLEDDLDQVVSTFGNDDHLKMLVDQLRPIVQSLPEEDDENFIEALEAVRTHIAENYKLHRRILRNRRKSNPWATPKRAGLRRVSYSCQDHLLRHTCLEDLRLQLFNEGSNDELAKLLFQYAVQPTKEESLERLIRLFSNSTDEHFAQAARFDELGKQLQEQELRLRVLTNEVKKLLEVQQTQIAVFCDGIQTADNVFEALKALLRNQVVRHQIWSSEEIDFEIKTLAQDDWRRFMLQSESCRVIVCDRRAEEGLNLHGGRKVVIHYELPNSPNSVEQRMGRFDRFGSGSAIESVAIVCSDDPDEIAWLDCLEKGFEVFENSLASLQYLVDESLSLLPENWMGKGTQALVEMTDLLTGKTGWIARERRRIDQQDTLDSLGTVVDLSFDELESVDNDWNSWGESFHGLAVKTLQLSHVALPWNSPLAKGEDVFRVRYSLNGNSPTLFPLPVFISEFIGTLDVDAPGANSRNLLSFPYSLRRNTSLSRLGVQQRVRPLRFGDPLIESLLSFCQTDDRGRVFAMWRFWPGYVPNDSSGHDLFFRFDFLIEAELTDEDNLNNNLEEVSIRALRRRLDGCFQPDFISVWVGVDRHVVVNPSDFLTSNYRQKSKELGIGRDFNLNSSRWQQLSVRDDVPWLTEWKQTCECSYSDALNHVKSLPSLHERISKAQRLLTENYQARVTQLKNRIERLNGVARQSEEVELLSENERYAKLKRAIASPKISLDVVGAIILSPENFES